MNKKNKNKEKQNNKKTEKNKLEKRGIFVIQEHKSEKAGLHYDLRLEIKNILKSWAIPKKPPLKPGIKRLAINVSDHNIDYADFEGKIKKGYGKGKVKIWDKGTYKTKEKPEKILKNNKLNIYFQGKKLKNKYTLLKLKNKNWLFFKVKEK